MLAVAAQVDVGEPCYSKRKGIQLIECWSRMECQAFRCDHCEITPCLATCATTCEGWKEVPIDAASMLRKPLAGWNDAEPLPNDSVRPQRPLHLRADRVARSARAGLLALQKHQGG